MDSDRNNSSGDVSNIIEVRDLKVHFKLKGSFVSDFGGKAKIKASGGIVSLEDLLEEIVGEIEDEHDREDPDIVSLGDSRWRVNGGIAIDDLAEAMGVAFPEGDYDTLGGMIFAQMNAIPEDGSTPELSIAGLRMKVTELADHRVAWVEVSKPSIVERPAKPDGEAG